MKAFFDTNVLVYALENSDPRKHDAALALIHQHGRDNTLVLSTQVMLELFSAMTRKHGAPAARVLESLRLLAMREVVGSNADFVLRAMALATTHHLSHWDGAIVQAALDARCEVLFTEDLQAGRRFGELEVVNPFAPGAHEATLASVSPKPRRRAVASRPKRL